MTIFNSLRAGVCTLEATHLNGENDPPLKHRSFFQPAHIAAVESFTPTMAGDKVLREPY